MTPGMPMRATPSLSLRPGVAFAVEDARLRCAAPVRLDLGPVHPGLERMLQRLEAQEVPREGLLAEVASSGHWADTPRAMQLLQTLDAVGLLRRHFTLSNGGRVTLEPLARGLSIDLERVPPAEAAWSPHAWIRRVDGESLVECALGHARLRTDAAGLQALLQDDAEPLARALLHGIGALVDAEPDGLRTWAFHDLLFHTRTRKGRHGDPHGATYRFVGQLEPEPAFRPPEGAVVALPAPEDDLGGRTLAEVLGRRRAVRRYASGDLSASTLASFLHAVFHVREVRTHTVPHPGAEPSASLQIQSRAYPSGGGIHELEPYVAVMRVEGLAPGLYRYLADRHALELVAEPSSAFAGLFVDACVAAGQQEPPPVLLILAARFARMAWKYEAIAYAAMLKHVGVVQQTASLVATALDLGCCPLGSGDADRFARLSGRPYLVEGSIGELMLGALPGEAP